MRRIDADELEDETVDQAQAATAAMVERASDTTLNRQLTTAMAEDQRASTRDYLDDDQEAE